MHSSTGWIPVAASHLLEPGKVMPVVVQGRDVALWRGAAGEAHAWVDRCPHRGMKLSLGAVAGDALICPYHGWRFGADAQCEQMPAHPSTTPARAARAQPFKSREEHGFVWMLPGSAGTVDEQTPQEGLPLATAAKRPLRSLTMAGRLADVAAGLMILPLAPPSAPWSGWRWHRSGADLHVEAHCGAEVYRAALRPSGLIEAAWTAAPSSLDYGFRLVEAAAGQVTVHVTAGRDTTLVDQSMLLRALAAARHWLALHPDDPDWARARDHTLDEEPMA